METREGWKIMVGVSNSTITDGVGVPDTVKVGDITSPGHVPDIEVYIAELTPNASGLPSDNPQKEIVEVTNPLTKETSSATIPRIQTIRCQYMGGQNFLVPCVHKGEQVWVLQHEGGELAYYWLPMGRLDDQGIRLHEHIRWFAMNQPKSIDKDTHKAADVGDENSYFIDINTNKGQKLIHIHTAINDGEPVGYDIRIAPEKGILEIVDTMQLDASGIGAGNYIRLDSLNTIWKIRNIDESYIELNKQNITISCLNNITINAGNNIDVTAGSNITTKAGSTIDTSAGSSMHDEAPDYSNTSNSQSFSGSSMSASMSTISMNAAITFSGSSFIVGSASGMVPVIIVYGSNAW